MTLGRRNAVYQRPEGQRRHLDARRQHQPFDRHLRDQRRAPCRSSSTAAPTGTYAVARAEVNGMLVWADDGKLTSRRPHYRPRRCPDGHLRPDLIRFDAEIEARSQLASVAAQSWDIATQAASTGTAATGRAEPVGQPDGATLAQVGALSTFGIETVASPDRQRPADRGEGAAGPRRARPDPRPRAFPGQRQGEARGDAGARRSRRPLQRHALDLRRGAPDRGRGLDHRGRASASPRNGAATGAVSTCPAPPA